MPDFSITQRKIASLLEELRTWGPGEKRYTLHELGDRFKLDIFVIDRLARSEGLKLDPGFDKKLLEEKLLRPQKQWVDPDADTRDLNPKKVRAALRKPDPNPEYSEDADTGVWKRHPTGEWELVDPSKKSSED